MSVSRLRPFPVFVLFASLLLAIPLARGPAGSSPAHEPAATPEETAAQYLSLHSSPVDLVLSQDESWMAVLNQGTENVTLLSLPSGDVLSELSVGARPIDIDLAPNDKTLLVTCAEAGTLMVVEVQEAQLFHRATIDVGMEPYGVAAAPDSEQAYVARSAAAEIAVVDLVQQTVVDTISVGRWPRYLDVSADGSRLAVGTSGDRGATIVDLEKGEMLYLDRFVGLNLGHMKISDDGAYGYFPWMVYRQNPITVGNIRLGWVLASRIARIRLDEKQRREAFSLDPQGKAIADPHGIDLTPDGRLLVVSASGTHELLVYQHEGLPFESYGSTDHVDPELLADSDRFYRIELGGRPMGIAASQDNETVYVANYLRDSVQVVNVAQRQVTKEMELGGPNEMSLARQGEAIFYDAGRSLDQWYSCHTCHYEGGTNAAAMDTMNDDSTFTFKTVLPLFDVAETGPWTWHGWQTDLDAAMEKSLTSTMQGRAPSQQEVQAMIAFLQTLRRPANPHRAEDGSLTPAAQRGKMVFESDAAGCTECHVGPHYTDNEVHDVGLGRPRDRYTGFNTPTLSGVHRKVLFLHDGRADSLEEVLTESHSPEKVSGGSLTDDERADLIEYLKSL